jgi:hypothetical protein
MRRQIGFLFSIAILILASTSASAQRVQPREGMPSDEVPATCPAGSHWVDAGYHGVGPKYKEGHCQKEFAHMPYGRPH